MVSRRVEGPRACACAVPGYCAASSQESALHRYGRLQTSGAVNLRFRPRADIATAAYTRSKLISGCINNFPCSKATTS